MLIAERDALHLCLVLEEGVDVLHERHEVGLRHVHLHHSLVDLSQVHELVDEAEDALRVAANGLVDAAAVRIVVLLHEREQWCDDERHRRANLVTDVHEEAQLRLTHLLGVYVLLQAQAVLLAAAALAQILPDAHSEQEGVEAVGPPRAEPRAVDDNRKDTLLGLHAVAFGLDVELIGARREVGEGDFILARLQSHGCLVVNLIDIGDVLRGVVGERRQLNGERVVAVAQVEAVAGNHRGVAHIVVPRPGGAAYVLTVDEEGGELHTGLPLLLRYLQWVEPRDAAHAAEQHQAVGSGPRCSGRELVRLQSIVDEEVLCAARLRVVAAQAAIGRNPQSAALVLLH